MLIIFNNICQNVVSSDMVLKNIFFKYMFSSIIGKYWNYTIIKKEDTCDHRGSSSALSDN